MFGSQKNYLPPPAKAARGSQPIRPAGVEARDEVYIMPEKFHPQKMKSSSTKTLIIATAVLLIIATAAGSYLIYDQWQQNQTPVGISANKNTTMVIENINTNIEANINTGLNANENINVNTNANLNANENENINANLNANENINADISVSQPLIIVRSGDADKDGLTDLEEALIGSSPSSPDSDQDGYLDSAEIISGYNPIINPASGQPFRLAEASFISQLTTDFSDDNFSLSYIKGWPVNLIEALHEARIITATGEMIKVAVADNPNQVSAANWYLSDPKNSSVTLSQLNSLEFRDFKGIYSPDGLAVYLTDSKREKIYIFQYDLDEMTEFRYPTIFEMVIRSLSIGAAATSSSMAI
ncbi:MAG: hypothetical protein A3A02_01445 [Candidatus Buchananbacteria bacterium RIFCSPLOWO2_01_FULL_39_33]|uniref:EF-hand domain-containing protein n=1 Tax=Candidatus Buchananbacteria bacterium RIFCSPLOWO2_01_FULL_39_33 TaxID=1797543 RepID=A0A1G1YI06_9BACT|nr:MAG: hypothetical protein A2820_02360 [Candidatus Buchananbacteria bacterium RIFCSPHIGHO2_01_FULL_40_35]OGY51952.1 MAG: hypothetical protein A3A02_01445 [Candidatus Buchananbacteria bacterium RIFCSPLOWO2_01_FULL_39_33]